MSNVILSNASDALYAAAIANIASLPKSAAQISQLNNKLSAQYSQLGVDSPQYTKTQTESEIGQLGLIASTCLAMTFLLNAGTSGATYCAGDFKLNLQIDSNLSAQTTVFGIPAQLPVKEKVEWVKRQFKFLVKKGDTVRLGQPWFSVIQNGVEVLGEEYSKGTGEFEFRVYETPELGFENIRFESRADQATTAQVTLKVRGAHCATSSVEKVTADGIKAALVPMPTRLKSLADLALGGFLMYESLGSHEENIKAIKAGKAVRIPTASISIGAESYKGASALRNMAACHMLLHEGQQYEMTEHVVEGEGVQGKVVYESDKQVEFANKVTEYQVHNVCFVRAVSQRVWENWKAQHANTPDCTFMEHEGMFLVFHTLPARFGALHLTVELSSTLENRSWKRGKVYLEALATLNSINPYLGRVLWLTGAAGRRKVDMLLQCANAKEAPENLPVWDQNTVAALASGTLKDVLCKLPAMVWIKDSTNHKHLVSFGVAALIGMTPSGGTNTLARAGRDLALHFAAPISARQDNWSSVLNQLLGAWRGALNVEMAGSSQKDRSKLLKDMTKSGNVLSTCKVRGINTAWSESGKVYLSSKDTWAPMLKGKTVIFQRNPIVGYLPGEMVIVGPDEIADIKTDRDVIGAGVLYVEHEDWYRGNTGDDDGDLVSFLVLDDLVNWVLKNPKVLQQDRKLQEAWGHLAKTTK